MKNGEETIGRCAAHEFFCRLREGRRERIIVVDRGYHITEADHAAGGSDESGPDDGRKAFERHCYEVNHGYEKPCHELGEECFIRDVFESGFPRTWLRRCVSSDGSTSWVEISASPLRDDTGAVTRVILLSKNVTELVEARESLKESEAFNRTILENSPDAVLVLDSGGRVLFINESGRRLMEIDDEDAYLRRRWLDLWTVKERSLMEKALVDAKSGQNGFFEGCLPTSTGRTMWWDVVVTSVADATGRLLVVMRNITARREYETVLRRMATVIDQVDESIVITDKSGEIVYVNPAFERITGYSRSDVIGNNPRILKSGKHSPSFYEEMWRRLEEGKTWKGRFKNRRKDGTLFDEDASISPAVNSEGEITHYVGVKRDVTREVEKERQLRHAQKMEAIGTLAGGIAHDFNNILSSIIGFSELALDAAAPGSRQYDHIRDVLSAGKRAADLVRQILAVSRQGSQSDPQLRAPIDVAPVVRDAMALIRASLPSTIRIRERIANDLPAIVADPTQIHQVVLNLCTNAHHAMRDTGGTLTVCLNERYVEDRVAGLPAGRYVELRVQDTGAGIAPEIRDRIFDPYFTTKNQQEGTGLGLAVVDGIARDHGGCVVVESEAGNGAVFTVLLPASARKAKEDEVDAETDLPKGTERILLVDDEEPIARVLEAYLLGLGYNVTMHTDSSETLATFAASPDRFDLVVTDMTMPQLTGNRLSRSIHEIRPDVPVIICTGFTEELDESEAARAGIDAYLRKPVDRATLAAAVRAVLDRKPPSPRAQA